MTNILTKYQRNAKAYIKLPSGSNYYNGQVELAMDGTLGVRAMTARDELLLKSPDALLNGAAITNIISSCCPGIKISPKDLIAPDVEVILLAIFNVSYGDNLEFTSKCPSCTRENTYTASIQAVLDSTVELTFPYVIEDTVTLDNTDYIIKYYVKPHTYETLTKKSLFEFENAKILQHINNPNLDDETKLKEFGTSFNKMAEYNFDIISNSIEKIETPDGVCTDQTDINSFIKDASTVLIEKINNMIQKANISGSNDTFSAKCQNTECNHEWKTRIQFDPSIFFVSSFKH